MTRFRSVCAQGHLTKKEQHLRHYKIEKSKKVGKNFLMMKSRVEDHLNTRSASSPYTIQNINVRGIVKEIDSCRMGVSYKKQHMTVFVFY